MSLIQSSTSSGARVARGDSVASPSRLGAWDLVRLIGQGHLTCVYQARPAGAPADQPGNYAVKLLDGQWQSDPRAVELLAREALVGRQVGHAHLVPVLAANLNETPHYLVMPLLDGPSLAAWLPAAAPLELPVAFWIARQVAEALAALDTAGWMHADVKPSNIIVSPSGHATLVDLGFARHADERNSIVDRPLVGTLNYMAPEVVYSALGGDIRSDVYSLGVTLFEMLTGRLPFDGQDIVELTSQHRLELPGDVRGLVPHVPTRGARLIHQMLAKQPLRRPTPSELIDRLARLEIETFAERPPQ